MFEKTSSSSYHHEFQFSFDFYHFFRKKTELKQQSLLGTTPVLDVAGNMYSDCIFYNDGAVTDDRKIGSTIEPKTNPT
jgi:hypothetical protein